MIIEGLLGVNSRMSCCMKQKEFVIIENFLELPNVQVYGMHVIDSLNLD